MFLIELTAAVIDDQGRAVHLSLDPATRRSVCEQHPVVHSCDHRLALIDALTTRTLEEAVHALPVPTQR